MANRSQIKERRLMAVVVGANGEVYTRYYHDDPLTLKRWMTREGYDMSPDFDYFIQPNPFYVLETA